MKSEYTLIVNSLKLSVNAMDFVRGFISNNVFIPPVDSKDDCVWTVQAGSLNLSNFTITPVHQLYYYQHENID